MDYRTKDDLLAQAEAYLQVGGGAVWVDEDALEQAAAQFTVPERLPDWNNYLSPEAQDPYDIARAAFELALNASQNAGYTERGPSGTTKWQINGSGSSALRDFLVEMRIKKRLPGIDLTAEKVPEALGPMLAGEVGIPGLEGQKVPFASDREAMFAEFAAPSAQATIARILAAAATPQGYHFTFENTVLPLRRHFPRSFGEDPLCKKALLMPILLTANAQAHGVQATTDVCLPADYRLPVTLNHLGILHVAEELQNLINHNEMMEQDDPRLLAIRGATLLACERLRQKTGLPPQQLDAALWTAASPSPPVPSVTPHADRIKPMDWLDRAPNSHGLWI